MRIQVLKSFRGRGTSATLAQVAKVIRNGKNYYQVAAVNVESRQVVELFEFPVTWGIWTGREFLMSSDAKASGRTTNAYDNSGGPDLLQVALGIMSKMKVKDATPREMWRHAYWRARNDKNPII
jgi:hypothetical protein